MVDPARREPVIGVVGPCGAGKSTLIASLRRYGIECRHIAQDHSYVPRMWERIANPDLLIYLEASFPVCTARRRLNWIQADYQEQLRRLEHARQHASLAVDTNSLAAEQVLAQVVAFLTSRGLTLRNPT